LIRAETRNSACIAELKTGHAKTGMMEQIMGILAEWSVASNGRAIAQNMHWKPWRPLEEIAQDATILELILSSLMVMPSNANGATGLQTANSICRTSRIWHGSQRPKTPAPN